MLLTGDTEKFPHALGFENLDTFFRVSEQGPCFTVVEEDRGDKRFVDIQAMQFANPLVIVNKTTPPI